MAAIMENREYEFGIWGKWWRDFGFGFGFWNFFFYVCFQEKVYQEDKKVQREKINEIQVLFSLGHRVVQVAIYVPINSILFCPLDALVFFIHHLMTETILSQY